jgi:hypothetical protein
MQLGWQLQKNCMQQGNAQGEMQELRMGNAGGEDVQDADFEEVK